jgi:hypothetical protein
VKAFALTFPIELQLKGHEIFLQVLLGFCSDSILGVVLAPEIFSPFQSLSFEHIQIFRGRITESNTNSILLDQIAGEIHNDHFYDSQS